MAKLTPGTLDAKFISAAAKKVCKTEHMTPRWYEPLNSNLPTTYDDNEYPVMRVWNTQREIIITNFDLAYMTRFA